MSGSVVRRAPWRRRVGGRVVAVVVVAVAAALLLLAVTIVAVVRSEAANQWLRARIAERLGPRIHFSASRATWWPGPGLVLDDVAILPDASDPAPMHIAAGRVTCRIETSALLRREVAIGSVQIDDWRADVAISGGPPGGDPVAAALRWIGANAPAGGLPRIRLRDGAVAVRAVPGPAAPATPAGAPTLAAHVVEALLVPEGAGARAEIAAALEPRGSVTARAALASLADADTARLTVALEGSQLDAAAAAAWLPPDPDRLAAAGLLRATVNAAREGAAPLAGDVTLELADGVLAGAAWRLEGPLRLTGRTTWTGSAVTVADGRLDAARVSAADVSAEAVAASFSYDGAMLRVPSAELHAFGGSWQGAVRVGMTGPASIDGTVSGSGVACDALSAAAAARGLGFDLPRCAAPVEVSATGSGSADGTWSVRADLSSTGALLWRDSRADGPLRISADATGTGDWVESASGTARARALSARGVSADRIDAAFDYAGGALRLAPARASAFGGTWNYRGTVPLDEATAWGGALGIERVDTAALAAAAGPPLAASALRGTVDATAELRGTGTSAVSATTTIRVASDVFAIGEAVRVAAPAELGAAVQYRGGELRLTAGRLRANRVEHGRLAAGAVALRFAAKPGGALQIEAAEGTAFGGHWRASGLLGLGAAPRWNATVHGAHVDVDDLLAAVDGGDDAPRSLGAVGDVDADVRQTPGGPKGTVGVQLKTGTFTWDALVVDAPAKANGSFAVQRDGDVALTGVSASAVRARYGPLVGTEATARLHYADDRLTFDRLHFHAAEGVWSHTGWFMLAERGRFAGQLGVEGVAPHALAAMLDETELELPFERIDFDGEFHGLAISEWKSALLMSGSVYLSDGTLQSANILRPIWNALVGGGWMRSEVDRPTRVQEVSASFILRQGQFDTTDLSLVSDDYRVTGAGSVDMSGALDLQTRIQLTASGMQKMFLFAALPLPTGNLPSLPPIPARVSGTLDAPVIRPNVAALPSATARWFVDAVLNTPLSMGDAVVRRLENVWNGVGRLFGGGAAEEPAAAAD